MSTTVDENKGQCTLTLCLYLKQLYYFACGSSHMFGGGLSLKLLSLYSKLPKIYALWSKTSLQRWLRPQIV
jgi:hypothetical protein